MIFRPHPLREISMDNQLYNKIYNIPKTDNPFLGYLYARGYLISDKPIVVKESWLSMEFGNGLCITYDKQNECEYVTVGDNWVLILGTVMDTLSWHMDIKRIARNIAEKFAMSDNIFYNYLDYLGGRHLIVYGNREEAYLLQDATGMRSAFYHRHSLLIASHYNIIQNIVNSKRYAFVEEFVQRKPLPWLLPGNTTPYEDIMALMPNHRLTLSNRALKRFFPRENHLHVEVNQAMDYIAECCEKQLLTLAANKKLMLSITKGNDSRITMAAANKLSRSILYYTYYGEQDPSQMSDLCFTREFARKHELNFLEVSNSFEGTSSQYDTLTDVCYHNHYHFHLFYSVPNMLKTLPHDRIAIRSNLIEIIRSDYFSDLPAHSDWEKVAARLYYADKIKDPDYRAVMKRFFYENEYDKTYDYVTGDLIYWEYRMGLWMNGAVLLKDDICFDTYMLFNHRKMLEYGLGIPRYFKKKNFVVHEVIRRLCPELLFDIPNTDYSLMDYYLPDSKNMAEIQTGEVIGYHGKEKKKIPVYSHLGRYHSLLGYGSSQIKKGDICEYVIELPISVEGVYTIQIDIYVSGELNYTKNFAQYSIFVDDERCFKLGISEFLNKENQINIIKKLQAGKTNVSIQLEATADYDASMNTPGMLQIRSITAARQWNYAEPSQTLVLSTSDSFSSKILKKRK